MKNIRYTQEEIDLIDRILAYLENTKEEDWQLDIVRSKDSKKNCLFGHIFNIGCLGFQLHGKYYDEEVGGNMLWDWFEGALSTTFQVFLINDGKDDRYKQQTAKDRCIAFIKDIRCKNEENTFESMKRCGRISLFNELSLEIRGFLYSLYDKYGREFEISKQDLLKFCMCDEDKIDYMVEVLSNKNSIELKQKDHICFIQIFDF